MPSRSTPCVHHPVNKSAAEHYYLWSTTDRCGRKQFEKENTERTEWYRKHHINSLLYWLVSIAGSAVFFVFGERVLVEQGCRWRRVWMDRLIRSNCNLWRNGTFIILLSSLNSNKLLWFWTASITKGERNLKSIYHDKQLSRFGSCLLDP